MGHPQEVHCQFVNSPGSWRFGEWFWDISPQKKSHPQWVNPKLFLRNINCCVSTSQLTIFPTHLFKLLVLLPVSPFERAERQPQQKDSAVKPCKALNQPHAMLFPREIMINHNFRTCVSSLLPTQIRRVGIPLMLMGNLLASKSWVPCERHGSWRERTWTTRSSFLQKRLHLSMCATARCFFSNLCKYLNLGLALVVQQKFLAGDSHRWIQTVVSRWSWPGPSPTVAVLTKQST